MVRAVGPYEERFLQALLSEIKPGDCVWDVGANVGDYSAAFLNLVGDCGAVIAIEPSPACCREIRLRAPGATVVEAALSDVDGAAPFSLADPTAVSNHLGASPQQETIEVRVMRADSAVAEGVRRPNLVKIDVEGYESEVLAGMDVLLGDVHLRALFVEVHFGELAKRGRHPREVTDRLQSAGFSLRWTDPSHVVANRG